MNETQAKAWLTEHLNVPRETFEKLEAYHACVRNEQAKQNLVSSTTLPSFWSRHIVDSAQLVLLANAGSWLDIGSGAGIPGIITALLTGSQTILVEPRARRADFLCRAAEALDLGCVKVIPTNVQRMQPRIFDNITARAVAALPELIVIASPFANSKTVWLLPKGKTAQTELASLPRACQSAWATHPSVTDPDSLILIGRHVKVMGKR